MKKIQRSEIFRIQDHLFEFSIGVPSNYEFNAEEVQTLLESGIAFAIKDLQTQYKDQEEQYSQLFVVFRDRVYKKQVGNDDEEEAGDLHVYNSGHYALWQDPNAISTEIMNELSTYFQSNKQFKLNKGFYLSLTVVHVNHERHRQQNYQSYKPPKQVGGYLRDDFLKSYGLSVNNRNYYEVPEELSNQGLCLPTCLLVSFCRGQDQSYKFLKKRTVRTPHQEALLKKLETCPYRKLALKINKLKSKTRRSYSLNLLHGSVKKLLRENNLENCTNFRIPIEGVQLAEHLGLQLFVYSRIGNKKIYQWPEKRDVKRISTMLYYQEFLDEPRAHPSLIYAKTFFKQNSECQHCGKTITHKGNYHRCQSTCFACRGYITTETDPHYSLLHLRHLCTRHREKKEFKKCNKCQVTCANEACLKRHQASAQCGSGFSCRLCGRFTKKTSDIPDYNVFRATHDCKLHTCGLCKEEYSEDDPFDHICKVKSVKLPGYYPNLAFFDTETLLENTSPESCKECFSLELEYLKGKADMGLSRNELVEKCIQEKTLSQIRCQNHVFSGGQRSYHQTNALCTYFEDEERGRFSRMNFYDPSMNMSDDCVLERHVLHAPYFLPEQEPAQKKVEIANQVVKRMRKENVEEVLRCPKQTFTSPDSEFNQNLSAIKKCQPIVKFLLFIHQEDFRNYVFFSHNGQGFDHQLIVDAAYHLGIEPKLLSRGQKVMSVTFEKFNIRFLDFMLYKQGSLANLAKRAEIPMEKIDFPYEFNQRENYNYSGDIPGNEHFGKLLENSDVKNSRNRELEKRRRNGYVWTFKDEIRRYVMSDVEILTKLGTSFAKECFEFQRLCTRKFKTTDYDEFIKEKDIFLLHPYAAPFLTISSYVFGTWKFHQLVHAPLYAINDEKGLKTINTSKGEREWVNYIVWSFSNKFDIESVYTSDKAPKIGNVRPDLFIPKLKKVGEFRGCKIHGIL